MPFAMGDKTYLQRQMEAGGFSGCARVASRYDTESGINGVRFIISIVVIGLSADLVDRSRDGPFRYAAAYNLALVSTFLV